MENRRHFSRILFEAPAYLIHGGQRDAVKLLDNSLKGALVQLRSGTEGPSPGAACRLEVPLTPGETEVTMEVQVAHRQEESLGLRCLRLDLDSASHLRRLVELNLGDEGMLQRELAALIGADH